MRNSADELRGEKPQFTEVGLLSHRAAYAVREFHYLEPLNLEHPF